MTWREYTTTQVKTNKRCESRAISIAIDVPMYKVQYAKTPDTVE